MIKKIYILTLTAIVFALSMQAGNKQLGVHIFGFATSFNDSTIYFTEIQYVDSAYMGKANMLLGRENYSYQLQNYLQTKGVKHAICITTFAKKQEQIEKKYLKMRKRYEKNSKFNIKFIPLNNFLYKAVTPQKDNN